MASAQDSIYNPTGPAMKIAVAFLVVALSHSCLGASGLLGSLLGGNMAGPASAVPNCLLKAVGKDLTNTIQAAGDLIGKVCAAQAVLKAAQDKTCEAAYSLLKDAGCGVDDLIALTGTDTVEKITSQVGKACDPAIAALTNLVNQVLSNAISKAGSALPLNTVTDTVCSLTPDLGDILKNLNTNELLGNLKLDKVLSVLSIARK